MSTIPSGSGERQPSRDGGPMPAAARIEVPPQTAFLEPAVSFVLTLAQERGACLGRGEQAGLKAAVAAVLEMVIANNARSGGQPVALEVAESGGRLRVSVINRGAPILLKGGRSGIHADYYSQTLPLMS